jgi:2-dehydro-3-deoxygluconokinase
VADVFTFGETMARLTGANIGPLRFSTHLAMGIAGAESNFAIGLSRLGNGVSWTGRVGDDEFGRLITGVLRAEGVTTHGIVDADAATGLLIKSKRTRSNTEVVYYRADSAGSRLTADDLDHDEIARSRVLHLTGITAALSASARAACFAAVETASAAGVTVSFDFNMRRKLWSEAEAGPVLRDLARKADIVFASDDEARIVVDGETNSELARGIAALGASEVVIKLGAGGALGLSEDTVSAAPVHVVEELDPVGAGDAFCAGYLHAYLGGEDLVRRLDAGARCGAYAVTVDGDWEGLPTAHELAHPSGDDVQR